jgi:hypothetical protein
MQLLSNSGVQILHMNKKIISLLLIFVGSLTSCIKKRSFSTPSHKHLYYEVEIKNDIKRKIQVSSRFENNILHLTFLNQKYCSHIQYDVEKLSTIETYQVPMAKYYMALGGLLMVLSLPSYYMGVFKSEGTPQIAQIAIGTGLFLLPGLALGGYALYKKLQEKVVKKEVGQVRRMLHTTESKCGKLPLTGNHIVEILTKTGYEMLGKLGSDGSLVVDMLIMEPLYSQSKNRYYFELFVQRDSVGVVYIPTKNKALPKGSTDKKIEKIVKPVKLLKKPTKK